MKPGAFPANGFSSRKYEHHIRSRNQSLTAGRSSYKIPFNNLGYSRANETTFWANKNLTELVARYLDVKTAATYINNKNILNASSELSVTD